MSSDKLFYDAHAKNVIVNCKGGRDLEDLIESGDLVGHRDPADMIQILYVASVPNLDTLDDPIYTYKSIGTIEFAIGDFLCTFYAYFRNIGKSETIPIGTLVVAEFNNIATISTLGGEWEQLGKITFCIDNIEKGFFAYKKIG